MSEDEQKISKFSSGINILMRLDNLWKNCQALKRSGQYYKWNEELDTVWLELARDLSPTQYFDLDKDKKPIKDSQKNKEVVTLGYKSQFLEFDEQLRKHLPFIDLGGVGFKSPSSDSMKNRGQQYKILMEKQLFLARLENELGKGTSWDEEDDDF